MTPATSATHAIPASESTQEALRLNNERMARSSVEGGSFGVTVAHLTQDGLHIEAPLPGGGHRPDPVDVSALLAVLADTGAGLAAAAGAVFGTGGSTVELRIDYAAPVDPGVRGLSVQSRRLHAAGAAVLADAVVTDDLGRVLVRGHGHFARSFNGPVADVELLPRAPAGSRLTELRAALRLPPSTGGPEGLAERSVPLPVVVANGRGQLHGAMVFVLAEQAQREFLGADARLLSMHVEYLRPVACDGSPACLRSVHVRLGRRFATLRTELIRVDGRPATIATGLWSIEA